MRGIQQKWWNKEKSCRGILKNTEREREMESYLEEFWGHQGVSKSFRKVAPEY